MTALAASRATEEWGAITLRSYKQGTTAIYKGGMVMINAAGWAVPAADTAGAKGVVGIATKDSPAAVTNGDKYVEVATGLFKLPATSITQAMLVDQMYVVDDQTFDDGTGTNSIKAGKLLHFESVTEGWLLINRTP